MDMTRFRTQLGGFHRADVANYIERTAREHRQIVQDLKDKLLTANAQLEASRKEGEELKAQLAAALEGVELPVLPEGDPAQLELEAYRRAEAAERTANARIRRQTEKMDGILDGMAEKFHIARDQMEELAQEFAAVLDAVQADFSTATAGMEALKKESNE